MCSTGALVSISSPPGESCDIKLPEDFLTIESRSQIQTQIQSLRLVPSLTLINLLRRLEEVGLPKVLPLLDAASASGEVRPYKAFTPVSRKISYAELC